MTVGFPPISSSVFQVVYFHVASPSNPLHFLHVPTPPKDLNVRKEQYAVEYQYLMHPSLQDVSCSAYHFLQRAYSMVGRIHHPVPTLEAVRL